MRTYENNLRYREGCSDIFEHSADVLAPLCRRRAAEWRKI
jgi:hypothetical protein